MNNLRAENGNGVAQSDPFLRLFPNWENTLTRRYIEHRPGLIRNIGRKVLFPLAFTGILLVPTSARIVNDPNTYHRHRTSVKPLTASDDELARAQANESIYPTIEGKHVIPPKPVIKIIGGRAIRVVQDTDGKSVYQFIPSPAIVYLPNGSPRAIGAPLPNSTIEVMDHFILCGDQPQPTIDYSPIGLGINGFGDTRIGTEQASTTNLDGCNYQYDIPAPR